MKHKCLNCVGTEPEFLSHMMWKLLLGCMPLSQVRKRSRGRVALVPSCAPAVLCSEVEWSHWLHVIFIFFLESVMYVIVSSSCFSSSCQVRLSAACLVEGLTTGHGGQFTAEWPLRYSEGRVLYCRTHTFLLEDVGDATTVYPAVCRSLRPKMTYDN